MFYSAGDSNAWKTWGAGGEDPSHYCQILDLSTFKGNNDTFWRKEILQWKKDEQDLAPFKKNSIFPLVINGEWIKILHLKANFREIR